MKVDWRFLDLKGVGDFENWVVFVIKDSTTLQTSDLRRKNELGNKFTLGPTA